MLTLSVTMKAIFDWITLILIFELYVSASSAVHENMVYVSLV